MDCSSSVGTAKTDHLAVDLAPTALSAWRSFRCLVGCGIGVRFSHDKHTLEFRKLCTPQRGSRRTWLLNKTGRPGEKRRGRQQSRSPARAWAQMENLRAQCGEAAFTANPWLC